MGRFGNIEFLRTLVRLCESTGHFYWLPRDPLLYDRAQSAFRFNNAYAGKRADSICPVSGYARIKFTLNKESVTIRAHRLVWAFAHEVWPPEMLDHINRKRADNRLGNLRPADHRLNGKNRNASKNSPTGVSGVHFCSSRKKWVARIVDNDGQRRHLGYFDTANSAQEVRENAELAYGYSDALCV